MSNPLLYYPMLYYLDFPLIANHSLIQQRFLVTEHGPGKALMGEMCSINHIITRHFDRGHFISFLWWLYYYTIYNVYIFYVQFNGGMLNVIHLSIITYHNYYCSPRWPQATLTENTWTALIKEVLFITAKKPNITDNNNYEPWIATSLFTLTSQSHSSWHQLHVTMGHLVHGAE